MASNIIKEDVQLPKDFQKCLAFVLYNVFTKEECEEYIQIAEKKGFEVALLNAGDRQVLATDVRNSSRCIWDTKEEVDKIWKRIKEYVPDVWCHREVMGLNERLRILRYDPGEYFRPHYDGMYKRHNGERSYVTVQIYLNEKMEKVKCEPCKVRNRNNVSIHWCVICEEALCSECTENHRSMKISRNHELIDINRMPIQTNIADQCCFKHGNLPFEYFCIDHDVLSCKECLAESHRSCQKVMSVDIACKGAKQSQSFIDATELVDHVLETTHTIGKDEQDFIENIAKETNSVKTAVRIVKEEAIGHIEALEKSLLHDLDLKKDKIIQKAKTTLKETEDIKKSTKDKQDIFDLVNKHGSEKQAFIAVHAYKQDLTDLEKRVTGITEKSTRFTINLNPQKLQESIHSIGSIELSEVPSAIKFVQKKKYQSQMPIVHSQSMPQFVYKRDLDIKYAHIYGMTKNDNNELILVDNEQCGSILVYDKNDNFKYQIETKHQPWDIALVPGKNSGVLTSYQEEVLQFVDFDRKKISGTVSLKESNQGGVAASNENIYVGCKGNINVLDLRGRFIRSIKTKNEKETPWFMTLDKSENIYYTDRQILSCIRSDGTEVYTYSAPDDDTLWKLAVDNNGYVYVAVHLKGVYRLRPDGTFMDIIIKDETYFPCVGICFNIQFTKMIVSRGNKVYVFNQK